MSKIIAGGMTKNINLRIVIAEDDELSLLILSRIIKNYGHTSIEFADGNQAWEYLLMYPLEVDIVILDKMMMQMHGMEVVQRMKQHPILKGTPIIMQSGDAIPEKIKSSLDTGIDAYITKPFHDFELMEIVNNIADKANIN